MEISQLCSRISIFLKNIKDIPSVFRKVMENVYYEKYLWFHFNICYTNISLEFYFFEKFFSILVEWDNKYLSEILIKIQVEKKNKSR